MPQFDVYKNPSKTSSKTFPFLVDIQNPYISELATRIVIPLGKLAAFKNKPLKGLTPEITYNGERLLLLTPQISSMPSKRLNKPIGSLKHFRDEIISAIDFAITGV
ncbi:MAG: plasmid maintenance protein CcdB [SAR86 cluster bacterium]|uniref:Toxin CcdB n=1 Tax=SAR86 cluster bacterium TaxID=2030880 RepID=A0A2A5C921_9GAMM|nr:CcdB family protein [bacterium AH-315-I11]MBN4075574.1 CcdB family protein [Gammaproteobacteria bacterium AH-315-E17]PCJ40369.1 MAG: plasmid maintenance protein CcdB [SAR86 cluster bacterium]